MKVKNLSEDALKQVIGGRDSTSINKIGVSVSDVAKCVFSFFKKCD